MKPTKKPIEPLDAHEFAALLEATGSGPIGLRDRALLELLLKSQLRIAEALALRESDYDAAACTVLVRRGKGGRQRLAVLHPSAAASLAAWIAWKHQRGYGDPLFCSLRGGQLFRQNVNRTVKRLARKAGVRKRVHCHGMRHSGARQLAAAGVPMNLIQSQLGHTSLATTSFYLEILSAAPRIKAITGMSWGGDE